MTESLLALPITPFCHGSSCRLLRTVIRSRMLTTPSMLRSALSGSHMNLLYGHLVILLGQTVHVPPKLSGHIVTLNDTWHWVRSAGQLVMLRGQAVSTCGHDVKAPTRSAHSVTSPVQRVGMLGHEVILIGHSVVTAGQIVTESAALMHAVGNVIPEQVVTVAGHAVGMDIRLQTVAIIGQIVGEPVPSGQMVRSAGEHCVITEKQFVGITGHCVLDRSQNVHIWSVSEHVVD